MATYTPDVWKTDISEYILSQDKDKPKTMAFMKSLFNEFQNIEDAAFDLIEKRWLDKALGAQLDRLGEIIGLERNFRDDYNYRFALYVQIMINHGGGTPEDIIQISSLLYKPSLVEYTDIYPACFQIFLQTTAIIPGIKKLISSISPAGIGDNIIVAIDGDMFGVIEASIYAGDLIINDADVLVVDYPQGQQANLQADLTKIEDYKDILGFSEQILTIANLLVSSIDDTIYFVDNIDTPLDLVPEIAYDDTDETNSGTLAEGFYE